MAWARLDDRAMEHPKIAALSDGAFRLWIQGLVYCRKFLTDGRIIGIALKQFPAYGPKRRAILIEAGLWEEATDGVFVHDYLQWNDSRQVVIQEREDAKERMRLRRGKSAPVPSNIPEPVRPNNSEGTSEKFRVPLGSTGSSGLVSVERGPGKTAPPKVAFDGSRLRVWHWQHEEFGRMLGAKASEFDLLAWYQRLDEALVRTGESYGDPAVWLRERFYADSGVPLPHLTGRKAVSDKSKLTQALEKASNW